MALLQKSILNWAIDTFGPIAADRVERAARVLEEAVELAQAEGLSKESVDKIAARVYDRPVGDTVLEVGSVGMSLAALCENLGLDMHKETLAQFDRCLARPKKEWSERHAAKVEAGTAEISEFKRYKMTQAQHAKMLDACRPVPAIALQCGPIRTPQENANAAWRALGDELEFDSKTVRPIEGEPETVFEARPIVSETRPVYDRGERYEISYVEQDTPNVKRIYGFTDDENVVDKALFEFNNHPTWRNPRVFDRARRAHIELNTPAELQIRAALSAVERLPADPRLSNAMFLLQDALTQVANYYDGVS